MAKKKTDEPKVYKEHPSVDQRITDTLRDKKGNVLIPIESTGRCLEIILMLERIWEESRLDSFKGYFLTK